MTTRLAYISKVPQDINAVLSVHEECLSAFIFNLRRLVSLTSDLTDLFLRTMRMHTFALKLIGMLRTLAGIQVAKEHDCNWAKHVCVPCAPLMFCTLSTFFPRLSDMIDRIAEWKIFLHMFRIVLMMHHLLKFMIIYVELSPFIRAFSCSYYETSGFFFYIYFISTEHMLDFQKKYIRRTKFM